MEKRNKNVWAVLQPPNFDVFKHPSDPTPIWSVPLHSMEVLMTKTKVGVREGKGRERGERGCLYSFLFRFPLTLFSEIGQPTAGFSCPSRRTASRHGKPWHGWFSYCPSYEYFWECCFLFPLALYFRWWIYCPPYKYLFFSLCRFQHRPHFQFR